MGSRIHQSFSPFKLSENESEDLKFTHWISRREREDILNGPMSVVDAGCGNGRNLIYLAREFGLQGVSIDISSAAIAKQKASVDLPIKYEVGNAGDLLKLEDGSQSLALDMMTPHTWMPLGANSYAMNFSVSQSLEVIYL